MSSDQAATEDTSAAHIAQQTPHLQAQETMQGGLVEKELPPIIDMPSSGIGESATPKKKKSVGFAPEPEQDLKDHHRYLDQRKRDKLQANPFWKIPAELSHLEQRREGPKPLPKLPTAIKPRKAKKFEDMKDLPTRAVKEISVVNRNTALNFSYHDVNIPVDADKILVDVKYASLSSLDLSKISKYALNVSKTRIGLGYDFVGEISLLGANYRDHPSYKIGQVVYGVTNPRDRKGSLQTLLVVDGRDVIVPIDPADIEKLGDIDLELSHSLKSPYIIDESEVLIPPSASTTLEGGATPASYNPKKVEAYQITEALPAMGKLCVFSSNFCRAMQSLEIVHSKLVKQGLANVLINGADTNLGRTIAQILTSSVYSDILHKLNVILVVLNVNVASMNEFVDSLGSGGLRKLHIVPFDVQNTDLVLPGETIPIAYKSPSLFASDILEKLFNFLPESESIEGNVENIKLDLFVDIIGSRKLFQQPLDFKLLDELNAPWKARLGQGSKVSTLLGAGKQPLFTRILQPKNTGSAYVSYCKFDLSEPSYEVDKLADHSAKSMFDPWSMKWSSNIANLFVAKYNYYEKMDLDIKQQWVKNALQLVLQGELKMRIDAFIDWRSNSRGHIENLKKRDGQVVFRIENF